MHGIEDLACAFVDDNVFYNTALPNLRELIMVVSTVVYVIFTIR